MAPGVLPGEESSSDEEDDAGGWEETKYSDHEADEVHWREKEKAVGQPQRKSPPQAPVVVNLRDEWELPRFKNLSRDEFLARWSESEDNVLITRPGKWGNPTKVHRENQL